MIYDLRPSERDALLDAADRLDCPGGELVGAVLKLSSTDYDGPTTTAMLMLDNERVLYEPARAATALACNAIVLANARNATANDDSRDRIAEETHGIVSQLADALKAIVESHPDIWQALEGRLAATFVTQYVRDGINAADWLRLARDWINEQRIQDGAEPIK